MPRFSRDEISGLQDRLERILSQKYRNINYEGQGGMAVVFIADEPPPLNRRVAIKTIPIHPDQKNAVRHRFELECRALIKAEHPNVLPIFDAAYVEEEHIAYIIQPYIRGGTLGEMIERKGACTERAGLDLAIEITAGLAHAHNEGVIHADIKPDNIYIDKERIYLGDFGIAVVADSAGHPQKTIGTLAYMSPERIRGKPPDVASDIYALGMVFYEIFAGHHPFLDEVAEVLLKSQLELKPPVPRGREALPVMLINFIMKLLEKDPGARPRSADDVLSDLKEIRADPGPRRSEGRPWFWPYLVPAGVVLLVGLFIQWQARKPEPRDKDQDPVSLPVEVADDLGMPPFQIKIDLSAGGDSQALLAAGRGTVRINEQETSVHLPGIVHCQEEAPGGRLVVYPPESHDVAFWPTHIVLDSLRTNDVREILFEVTRKAGR